MCFEDKDSDSVSKFSELVGAQDDEPIIETLVNELKEVWDNTTGNKSQVAKALNTIPNSSLKVAAKVCSNSNSSPETNEEIEHQASDHSKTAAPNCSWFRAF